MKHRIMRPDQRQHKSYQSRGGFTLIELLIVLAIIAILAGLLGSNFLSSRIRARDAERKNDLHQLQTALELYHNDNGRYPMAQTGSQANSIRPFSWGVDAFSDIDDPLNMSSPKNNTSTIYMPVLPSDPSAPTTQYYYETNAERTKFRVCARLANEEDGDIQQEYDGSGGASIRRCSETSSSTYCNYCVTSSNTTLTTW
jgi:type II secretion system protein G